MANKRRGKNEGSIYRRADGTWAASVNLGYIGGKRRRKVVYGKTRDQVRQKLRDLHRQQDAGATLTNKHQTVEQFLTYWLDHVAERTAKPQSVKLYRQRCTHIIHHIGRIHLDKLGPQHVEDMLYALTNAGLKAHLIRATLRAALNVALRYGWIVRNPAALAEAPASTTPKITPLTAAQATLLLDTVAGHRLDTLYRLALGLGMRQGELLALHWDDVDLDQATLTIHEGKTDASQRTLPLSPGLVAALKRQKTRQQRERLILGADWRGNGHVFTSEVGTPLRARNVVRHFKRLLTKAGLPETTRFHDLRHTAASLMLAQGVDLKTVSSILGHSTIATTANVYGHIYEQTQRQIITALDALFGT
jgi:integrase